MLSYDEALKLAKRIAKHPAPVTNQQAARALIMLYLKSWSVEPPERIVEGFVA
jgi:hypothetical protein